MDIDVRSEDEQEMMISNLHFNRGMFTKPVFIKLLLESKVVRFEVDCGTVVSVMQEQLFKSFFPHKAIEPDPDVCKNLRVITGENIHIVGSVEFEVRTRVNGTSEIMTLLIVRTTAEFTPLMGTSWLDKFCVGYIYIDWWGGESNEEER